MEKCCAWLLPTCIALLPEAQGLFFLAFKAGKRSPLPGTSMMHCSVLHIDGYGMGARPMRRFLASVHTSGARMRPALLRDPAHPAS